MINKNSKILITGGSGLVGQNLTIDVATTLTVYGNETGGSQTIPVTVTYKA